MKARIYERKRVSFILGFWGDENNLGTLLRVQKGRVFAGKNRKYNRAIYHTCYEAIFYNPEEKSLGKISSEQDFTAKLTTKTKSMMKKILKEKGFDIEDVEIWM